MELTPITTVLIAVISGLLGGGLLSGIATLIRGQSGAKKDISEAASELVEQYRKQVSELTSELEGVKKRLAGLEKIAQTLDDVIAGARRLVHQVRSLNAVPVYIPPDTGMKRSRKTQRTED